MVKSTKLNVDVAECTREPLVPVTVRTYVPAEVALQETVALPDPPTVPGIGVPQVRPAGGVLVRVTTPAKAFTCDIVIVEVADWPAFTAGGEDAVIVKSTKLKVELAEWRRAPLVPLTVSV